MSGEEAGGWLVCDGQERKRDFRAATRVAEAVMVEIGTMDSWIAV